MGKGSYKGCIAWRPLTPIKGFNVLYGLPFDLQVSEKEGIQVVEITGLSGEFGEGIKKEDHPLIMFRRSSDT